MGFFERYLTVWVLLCIVVGIFLGQWQPEVFSAVAGMEWNGVNAPIAVLIWLMIYPMMVQIDFSSLRKLGDHKRGLILTSVVNWAIKPFTMAAIAWFFFFVVFKNYLPEALAEEYLAGAILLGAAPCTAMVFVWSYLSGGNPNFTLVQVSLNDLVLLVLFIPIVQLLLGITGIAIPFNVLLTSVVVFVVVPLAAGYLSYRILTRTKGVEWFTSKFLPALKPISVGALLLTLVLLFALQGEEILRNPWYILLIAVPLIIQTYFIFFITWGAGKKMGLPYTQCAPAAMIGASNFFELAVAVAIALFGIGSGAALATVVGVLIEVPIMLSLVALAKRWRYI